MNAITFPDDIRIAVANCDFSRREVHEAAARAGLAEALGFQPEWYMDTYGERLSRSHITLYALCAGVVVGAVLIEPTVSTRVDRSYLPPSTESVAELGGLFVAPSVRGRGVAQALIRHASHWAGANEHTVICSIEPDNVASKKALSSAAGLTYLYTQEYLGVTLDEYVVGLPA